MELFVSTQNTMKTQVEDLWVSSGHWKDDERTWQTRRAVWEMEEGDMAGHEVGLSMVYQSQTWSPVSWYLRVCPVNFLCLSFLISKMELGRLLYQLDEFS